MCHIWHIMPLKFFLIGINSFVQQFANKNLIYRAQYVNIYRESILSNIIFINKIRMRRLNKLVQVMVIVAFLFCSSECRCVYKVLDDGTPEKVDN